MALVPNWIDVANETFASIRGGRSESIVVDGSTLWGVFPQNADETIYYLYKSIDAGVTWTDTGLDVGTGTSFYAPIFDSTGHRARTLIKHDGKLYYFGATNNGYIHWSVFDLSTPTLPWTEWAYLTGYSVALANSGTLFAGSREDADLILAYQSVAGSINNITVKKYNGSWSTIGTIEGTTYHGVLAYGMMDSSNGNAHIFFQRAIVDVDDPLAEVPDFCHVAVDFSDDSITSTHVIESAVDMQTGFGTPPVGPGDISGTAIAAPYGVDVQDQLYNSSSYGTLKVAFGDMTSDPLSPTWSTTTVAAEHTLDWPVQANQQCQVAYDGATPWVYYATPYPDAVGGTPYPNFLLRRSSYVSAAWTTPEVWYDSSVADAILDPLRATHNDLDTLANFQLVKGFASSFGIMVDVEQWYAGYEGPALRANNYVSAGGPMVSRGNYASA